jgi:hypothetical protein
MSEIIFYGIVAMLSFFVGMGVYHFITGIYAAIRVMCDKE